MLPNFDENKKSIIVTVLIGVTLGVSFVLFAISYKRLQSENVDLKSNLIQIETQSQAEKNLSDTKQQQESDSVESAAASSSNSRIEFNVTPASTPTSPPLPAPTQIVPPTPTSTPTPKFIVAATLTLEPSIGDVCGTNFKFRGYITANGAGTVIYRWKRTDAENVTSEPYPTVVFENAGTKEIDYYLTLTKNTDAEGWFEITSPESAASNRIRYIQQNC